jgi:hypothetical protein
MRSIAGLNEAMAADMESKLYLPAVYSLNRFHDNQTNIAFYLLSELFIFNHYCPTKI